MYAFKALTTTYCNIHRKNICIHTYFSDKPFSIHRHYASEVQGTHFIYNTEEIIADMLKIASYRIPSKV
jgi:hypothetical protein